MEKEKITIKDSKRNPQLVIDSDHPFFTYIKNTIMPDEYRKKSNGCNKTIEEQIKKYYEIIENPYIDDGIFKNIPRFFFELDSMPIND